MKILLANLFFTSYTGTEVVVRDLACAFQSSGHEPIVFATKTGKIAEELTRIGVHVTDDLSTVSEPPDIIHGHHHRPFVEALLRFPNTPAVSVCHDATNIMDEPFYHPRIKRYLAVDERCRQRVERTLGESAGKIGIMLNAVDLKRFQSRGPLPHRPGRALLFSNYANHRTHLNAVKRACRKARLPLDVMGEGMGTQSIAPERDLPRYDLVFAKARCALEALAVGNAVVLCDFAGAGPYVTSAELDRLRRFNFGQGLLTEPLDADRIAEQIARYNPEDASKVTDRIRAEAGLDLAVTDWVKLYQDIIEKFSPREVDRAAECKFYADYLASWHYLNRKDWELKQLSRLKTLPLIGEQLFQFSHQALKRFK